LEDISGEMPHPNGKIAVAYKIKKGSLHAEINLPENTTGNFMWKNKIYPLKTGKNSFTL
jgi:hypothetical protein